MQWRTNQVRQTRKATKATQIRETTKKQFHTSWHNKPGYVQIIQMIKTKPAGIKINAGRGKKKIFHSFRLFWIPQFGTCTAEAINKMYPKRAL